MDALLRLRDNLTGEGIEMQEKFIADNLEKYVKFEHFYSIPFENICQIVKYAGKIEPKVLYQLLKEANKKFGVKAIELLEFVEISNDYDLSKIEAILSLLSNIPLLDKFSFLTPLDTNEWDYEVDITEEDRLAQMFAPLQPPPNYEDDIFKASKHGNVESVLYRIAEIPTLLNNPKENNHYTPINVAAYYGQPSLVDVLIRRGALIEIPDVDGHTPLINAARKGHTECVEILLKNGAKVDVFDKKGNCALHYAAAGCYHLIAQALLRAGANVNARNANQETPLILASQVGDETTVQLLVDYHADINAKSAAGWNAEMLAKYDSIKRFLQSVRH